MINQTVQGDLIVEAKKLKYDVIVHGCNCHNTMGSGIAKAIKQVFPEMYEADCKTIAGDKSKLGTYSSADISLKVGRPCVGINAYTQFDFGRTKINVDYQAVEAVFAKLNKDFSGKKIGIPKIGAGLAGGDWATISEIINSVTPDIDIELVEFVEFMG